MNTNHYVVFDLECTSKFPHLAQITQIAAIAINPRTLRAEPNGVFNSEVQPIFDEEKALAAGYGPVEEEALRVTKKTREQLLLAPPLKMVWQKFTQFIHKFNPTKSAYKAPIPVGYNIINYDLPIIEKMCSIYGPQYKERGSLFNSMHRYDVFDMFEGYTESNPQIQSQKLSNCAEWIGIKIEENSLHDALTDVKVCANIFVKLMHLQRAVAQQTDFTRAYKDKELLI